MYVQRHSGDDTGPVEAVGLMLLAGLIVWPRLVIAGFGLFNSNLFDRAFGHWAVAVAGFLLLPFTTLAYASMWSISSDAVTGPEWTVVGIGILLDAWTWSAFRR